MALRRKGDRWGGVPPLFVSDEMRRISLSVTKLLAFLHRPPYYVTDNIDWEDTMPEMQNEQPARPKRRGRPPKDGTEAMSGRLRQRLSVERKREAMSDMHIMLYEALHAVHSSPDAQTNLFHRFATNGWARKVAERVIPTLDPTLQDLMGKMTGMRHRQ